MDVNRILLDILVVLLAAKVAAEVADRARIPAVVGEIAAGVIVGPSVLGWVHSSDALQTLAQLGVILLLLEVGLEMDLGDLASVGRASIAVAIVGVVLPLAGGTAAGLGLGMSGKEAVFVGAALTATSVGITARVFGDLRALASVEAKTVLGAAVADDILGLIILTVVTGIVSQGTVSAFGIAWIVIVAVGFVVLASAVGVRLIPPTFALIRRHSRSAGTLVALALAFALGVAELAHAAQLAPIVGAFVAGLALARSSAADRVRSELSPVAHLLVPVFFLQIGIDAHVEEFARPAVFGIAAVLLAVGVAGKLCSALGLLGAPGDRWLVGIGMIPRGEVGLIFATIGLRQHVFGQDVYAALLLVVLITTVVAPPALRWRLLRVRAARRASVTAPAPGGRPAVRVGATGEVELEAEPLPSDALVTALVAARLCSEHPPGAGLLEWLEAFPAGPRRWDDPAREELFRMLRDGGPRSWRLLTTSTVLQRALPELDDALHRRSASTIDLDPLEALRFPHLSAVREALHGHEELSYARAVLLAAFVLDACEDAPVEPRVVARRTVQRLDLGARVEQSVAALVDDARLLDAAARRADGLDEEAVLEIAVHLGDVAQADALYELTRATLTDDTWHRERLDALHDLVRAALAHPELVGREASNEVERRKSEAARLVQTKAVRERIEAAPREYVLGQSASELARQAILCEPPPGRDDVRVVVTGGDGDRRVDVVARDQVGLIARSTGVLRDAGCSVTHAIAATWGDGLALTAYRVHGCSQPEAAELREAILASFAAPLSAERMEGITFDFDNAASPWHTRCTVTGPDRAGLLHALTTAFASVGVNVHSARVATDGAQAVDAFNVTDRRGGKLDERLQETIALAVRSGVHKAQRRFARHRPRRGV